MTPRPTVCILAGGLGSRLGSRVADLPKALIRGRGPALLASSAALAGRPRRRRGRAVCIGYRGEQVERRIGHEQFGLRNEYSYDTRPSTELSERSAARSRCFPIVSSSSTAARTLDFARAADAWHTRGACSG